MERYGTDYFCFLSLGCQFRGLECLIRSSLGDTELGAGRLQVKVWVGGESLQNETRELPGRRQQMLVTFVKEGSPGTKDCKIWTGQNRGVWARVSVFNQDGQRVGEGEERHSHAVGGMIRKDRVRTSTWRL